MYIRQEKGTLHCIRMMCSSPMYWDKIIFYVKHMTMSQGEMAWLKRLKKDDPNRPWIREKENLHVFPLGGLFIPHV